MIAWVRPLARILLSAAFLLAGTLKALDPARFLLDVRSFELLPASLAWGTALVLPWLEIFCAFALWWRPLARGAALLLALATASFIAGLILAEARGLELECGCFGSWLVFPQLWMHLLFNAALLGSSLLLIRAPDRSRTSRAR